VVWNKKIYEIICHIFIKKCQWTWTNKLYHRWFVLLNFHLLLSSFCWKYLRIRFGVIAYSYMQLVILLDISFNTNPPTIRSTRTAFLLFEILSLSVMLLQHTKTFFFRKKINVNKIKTQFVLYYSCEWHLECPILPWDLLSRSSLWWNRWFAENHWTSQRLLRIDSSY